MTSTWLSFLPERSNMCELPTRTSSFHVSTSEVASSERLANEILSAFNLIEILFLILPFEWWLSAKSYERLNDIVMSIIYFPLLLVTSYLETRDARWIRWNRRHGEADDTVLQEWEDLAHEVGFDGLDESDEWVATVKKTKPNVDVTAAELGIRELKEQVRQLTETVKALTEKQKQEPAQDAA